MAIRVNGDFYITGEGCSLVTDKSVTVAKINSEEAASGEVLTADGSGGASFEPIIQMPDPTNAEDGDVLTAGDGEASWEAPYGKWIKHPTQNVVTIGAPALAVLADLDFPAYQEGLAVEWQASVAVMDNPNSIDLTSMYVAIVSSDDSVIVSKNIGEDEPSSFSSMYYMCGKFTVGETAVLGLSAIGEARSYTAAEAALDNGGLFAFPGGGPLTGSLKLRLAATKPVNDTGLQLKIVFFGYRII